MVGRTLKLEEFVVLLDGIDLVLKSHHVISEDFCFVQRVASIVVRLQNGERQPCEAGVIVSGLLPEVVYGDVLREKVTDVENLPLPG